MSRANGDRLGPHQSRKFAAFVSAGPQSAAGDIEDLELELKKTNMKVKNLRSRDRLDLASTRPHRGRVVFISSGTDHPAQNHHPVPADVPRCVHAFLCHHLAVDHHFGARFADGDVELKTRVPSRATSATLACVNGSEQVEHSVM